LGEVYNTVAVISPPTLKDEMMSKSYVPSTCLGLITRSALGRRFGLDPQKLDKSILDGVIPPPDTRHGAKLYYREADFPALATAIMGRPVRRKAVAG